MTESPFSCILFGKALTPRVAPWERGEPYGKRLSHPKAAHCRPVDFRTAHDAGQLLPAAVHHGRFRHCGPPGGGGGPGGGGRLLFADQRVYLHRHRRGSGRFGHHRTDLWPPGFFPDEALGVHGAAVLFGHQHCAGRGGPGLEPADYGAPPHPGEHPG